MLGINTLDLLPSILTREYVSKCIEDNNSWVKGIELPWISMIAQNITRRCIPVKLNEHKIPDFDDLWVIHIYKGLRVATSDLVVMNFCAWTTWTCFSHFPEIVLHSKWQHSLCRNSETNSKAVLIWDIPMFGYFFFIFLPFFVSKANCHR